MMLPEKWQKVIDNNEQYIYIYITINIFSCMCNRGFLCFEKTKLLSCQPNIIFNISSNVDTSGSESVFLSMFSTMFTDPQNNLSTVSFASNLTKLFEEYVK